MQEPTAKPKEAVTKHYPLKFQFNAKGGDYSEAEKLPQDEFLGDGSILCVYRNDENGLPQATFTLLTPGPLKDPYTLFLIWLNMGAWIVRLVKAQVTTLPEVLAQRAEGFSAFIMEVIQAATKSPTQQENTDGHSTDGNSSKPKPTNSAASEKRGRVHKAAKKTSKVNGGKRARK
jgi:hypothetical protein